MTIFAQNQDHSIPLKDVKKIIERQPWTAQEKEHVEGLFRADTHGRVTGEAIDKAFKRLNVKKDHTLQTHHLQKFHETLKVPFHSTLPPKSPMVTPPRLRI